MAPFDVPDISHDMILRFMNVNFSAIVDGSARIPSSVGGVSKPAFSNNTNPSGGTKESSKTPEQDKAMWEGVLLFISGLCVLFKKSDRFLLAYYNAGSAAAILLLIFAALGSFVYCRYRRRPLWLGSFSQSQTAKMGADGEESVPLNRINEDDEEVFTRRKGKERAVEAEEGEARETIFGVGDSDEDEDVYRDELGMNGKHK